MNKKILFFILVGVLAGVHVGTVRRTDDPIRNTQTDPIAYQQKMEEEKDGKKGPSSYSVKYNPSDTFFVAPPFDEKEKVSAKEKSRVEKPSALSDWWEEKPVQGTATSSSEDSSGGADVTEEKGLSPDETTEKAGSGSGSGNEAPSGDYWW